MSIILTFLLLLLLTACVLIGAFIALKLRKVHLFLFAFEERMSKRIDNQFSQQESLLSLYYDLKPRVSIPATRNWAGSPDFLLHIVGYMIAHKPNCVVECSSGVSTIVIARTLEINGVGHVFSLEHDPKFAEKTRNELKRHGLESYATVIDAPLTKIKINNSDWLWYSVASLPEILIDVVVVDGSPMNVQSLVRYPALPCLYSRMQKSAAIFLDDFNRPDETEIVNRWTKEFPVFKADFLSAEKGICYLNLKS
jgi:hypothetical protein